MKREINIINILYSQVLKKKLKCSEKEALVLVGGRLSLSLSLAKGKRKSWGKGNLRI